MKLFKSFFIFYLFSTFTTVPPLLAQTEPPRTNSVVNSVLPGIHELKAEGISNFYQLTERIYSGSAPESDAAFAGLQKLGIKTIITVDGMKPDTETARRYGIRYVHLPVGYNGITTNQAFRIIKAADSLPGPIFVHCHHGMHRGPTGAAVICMAEAGWTPEQAESWLHRVGTSPDYPGLYRTVEQFRPPKSDVLKNVPDNFSDKSNISPLADVMVQIDKQFDRIKLIKKADYRPLPAQPDLSPAPEALLLDELFKELLRSPGVENRTPDFRAKLGAAESASSGLYRALGREAIDMKDADAAFRNISDACSACHKAYRN